MTYSAKWADRFEEMVRPFVVRIGTGIRFRIPLNPLRASQSQAYGPICLVHMRATHCHS